MIIDENNQKISLSMSICLKAIFAVGVVLGLNNPGGITPPVRS